MPNFSAVKVQIWIAICAYLIVAIVRKEQEIVQPMSEILQVLGITQLEKKPIFELFKDDLSQSQNDLFCNQLTLFDL
jgi:hypothetical protein